MNVNHRRKNKASSKRNMKFSWYKKHLARMESRVNKTHLNKGKDEEIFSLPKSVEWDMM